VHAVAAIGLGLLLAASVFFVTRGLGAIVHKRWRGGLAALVGLGLFAVYVILLGAAALLLGLFGFHGTSIETYDKARILGENISVLMNSSVLGAPVGLLLGVASYIRSRRAPPITR
jgi:hypothetical protein